MSFKINGYVILGNCLEKSCFAAGVLHGNLFELLQVRNQLRYTMYAEAAFVVIT